MAEQSEIHIWVRRVIFAALCLSVIFWRLLPLDTLPRGWAGPDLIVALAFAWVLRRPEYAPPLLIAALVLLADLMFQRPPGLWAALVLIGSEALKSRAAGLRDMSFVPEWLTVSAVLVAMTLAERTALAILLVPQAPLALSLMQVVMTVLAYPLVVAASALLFRVRKLRPGDAAAMAGRA
ncbi:rod shape-determining protein MreD [Rhodobacteraceae bacterium KMM 6894]|nr:rod shape-determining protein MreD [Rhodobacteraceae bacterium KMM 6894]